MATVEQIIAAVNPDLYLKVSDDKMKAKQELGEFKKLIAEKGVQEAANKASPKSWTVNPDAVNANILAPIPSSHKIVYESYAETIEPLYYFVLDLVSEFGLNPEKLSDNFTAAPGSSTFQDLGQRKGVMQQQVSKIMGDVNIVLKSVINLIYDLRDFKIRLEQYEMLKDPKEEVRKAGRLALKQIWMDRVDMQRGTGSLNQLSSGNLQFVTLRDAFMISDSAKDVEKLDLNERVKRILMPRVEEFNLWLAQSEDELRKRYNLERVYLRTQVNNLKLYSRWVRPYLLQSESLESEIMRTSPELVNAFNRTLLQLTLFGKSELKIENEARLGNLPRDFLKMKFKRKYYSVVLVNFIFRSLPSQSVFTGKSTIEFKAYALNDEEIDLIKKESEKSEIGDVMKLISGMTDESLKQMQKDLDEFIPEEKSEGKKEEKKKEQKSEGANPFLALVGHYEKSGEEKSSSGKKISSDTWLEKTQLRPLAGFKASEMAFKLFDIYKKGHSMPSFT